MRRLAILAAVCLCACGAEDDGELETSVHPLLAALGSTKVEPNGVGNTKVEPNGVGNTKVEPDSVGNSNVEPNGVGNTDIEPNGLGTTVIGSPGPNPGGGNPGGGNPGGGGRDCAAACDKIEACGERLANCVGLCQQQADRQLVECIIDTPCDRILDRCG